MCLWEITRVFGKNNLVPTVTASFDVLEAGDMVEGCSIWVLVRVCGFEPVRGTFCRDARCLRWLVFSIWPLRRRVVRRSPYGVGCVTHPPTACP